jgi:hypothetical protein
MLKVSTSDSILSPYGGLAFVINELETAGIPQLIDSSLPKRHGGCEYRYSDAILSLVYGVMAGADRFNDLITFKEAVRGSSLNIPSPDQISKIMRNKLSVPSIGVTSKDGMVHKVNINMPLNRLLVDVAIKLGELSTTEPITLDYDNTCIECEKEDALWTYKQFRGYQPGVCFAGSIPVYIEGMNGNNPASFDQGNTLKRAVGLLESKGVKVGIFRADAASYQPEVIDLFSQDGCKFFIRAANNPDLMDYVMHQSPSEWKKVVLGKDEFEACSFDYVPQFKNNAHKKDAKKYRIVAQRRVALAPDAKGEYVYRSIITNDRKMTPYNNRGYMETQFTELNDWNWCKLPFSYLSENTAFMLVTALGFVAFNHVLKVFSRRVDFVEPTFRLKAFRFNAINVVAQWRGNSILIYDKSRPWEKLAG